MCNTAKEIWKTLLITHQGNSQVKDNKIDILVQQYEQFVISEDESIDSAFARFNTIITSLKALDEGYSSKNYVRKFLRALHLKWRAKKDSEIVKPKVERKSLALKAKKESSDEEFSTSRSKDEEYAMANGKNDRKYFRCGDPNHLIGEYPKPPKVKNQRAFVEGSWSDSGEEDDEKQKTGILELKRIYFEDYYSDNQYAVSIKEDMAYPCLHSPKPTKETSSIRRVASGLRPYHFTYPERKLTMEEMLYKFIDEGKREHEEMRAFIFKGVTARGGKTTTQDAQNNDTSVHTEEPHAVNHDEPVESEEVLRKPEAAPHKSTFN
ncbi:hypothetical protein Tco_1143689 [Tanacetum coccineum]